MCVRKAKFPMIMRWISKQQTTTSQTSLRFSVLTTMVLAGIFIAGQAANLARAESIDDAGLWWAFLPGSRAPASCQPAPPLVRARWV